MKATVIVALVVACSPAGGDPPSPPAPLHSAASPSPGLATDLPVSVPAGPSGSTVVTPAPRVTGRGGGETARPEPTGVSGRAITGVASWYHWHPGEAAAGPGLREWLGRRWRGQVVRVCAGGACTTVRLTDWCGCPNGRVIDLDDRTFGRLAPLSRGLITVTVRH